MTDQASREQFEARYPIPAGVEWSDKSSRYSLVEISTARNTGSTIARYEAYVHSWSVWKASREDVVVKLPDADGLNHEHMFVQGFLEGVSHSRTAIESAGMRVLP